MKKCACGNSIDYKYKMCLKCYVNKLGKDSITEWLNNLVQYWLNKDVDSIIKLFSDNAHCYDTPFSSAGNINDDWQEIKNQNIVSINYTELMRRDREIIVEFIIDYGDELCSAINHIKFDNDYKCNYLKQWYMCNNVKDV